MPKVKPNQHAEILEYALSHLEQERDALQAKINHIRQELGSRKTIPVRAAAPTTPSAEAGVEVAPRRKRILSESARKRIAAAQKRRWAEHRKKQKAAE
jgi:hypothetical protein